MYRVPKELLPDFHRFQEEFDEALELLRTNQSLIYLCGDCNIDLLKINTNNPGLESSTVLVLGTCT